MFLQFLVSCTDINITYFTCFLHGSEKLNKVNLVRLRCLLEVLILDNFKFVE